MSDTFTVDGKREYNAFDLDDWNDVPASWLFETYLPKQGSDTELLRRMQAGENPVRGGASAAWKRFKEQGE